MGGIVESVSQYIEIGSMIVLFAIAGYYIALGMWKFLGKLQRWNTHLVKVELVDSGTVVKIKGLIDTGNSLFDPVSGKPVSIVTREVAKNFVGNNKKIRYIPYQSVGKSDGVMPVFHIDEMRIIGQEPYCFQHILLGISEENVSLAGAYDMILNPNLF